MAKRTYELNFYETECGDGIYVPCGTKAEALKAFERLQSKYPNRTGDAFIRVFINYDTADQEKIKDIEIK